MGYLVYGLFATVVIVGLAYLIWSKLGTADGFGPLADRQEVLVFRSLSGGYFKVWTDLTPKEIEEIPGVIRAMPDETDRTGAIHVDMDRRYTGHYLRRELLRLTQHDDVPDVWSDAVDDALGKD